MMEALQPKGNALILGGEAHVVPFRVVLPGESGLEFVPKRGARRRYPKKTDIDLIVLHWTGGEGPAERVFRVLYKRRLGVEFVIDRDGVCYQFADPITTDTFDAGAVNPRSIGVEMVNYGYRKWWRNIPRKGRDRVIDHQMLQGGKRGVARFYPDQMRTMVMLCDALVDLVPTIPANIPKVWNGHCWKVRPSRMDKHEIADFKGVLGHYHLTRRKLDPGLEPFRVLMRAGY